MKKLKNLLLTLLSVTFIGATAVGIGACAGNNEQVEQTEIEKVYAQYVIHAEAEGETPLSYEEWLATIKGEKGDKGDKGETGEQGPQGEKGEDGKDGQDGKDGVDGQDGKDGVDGEDGKSAYQIWLDNGNTGTEEDFLAWLKGLNDHSFGEWQVFTQGEGIPCEQRMFFRICTDCNAIEWKNGSADDHDWTVATTAPTCQAQGFDTKTCDICGKVETENYTAIADHAWATEYSYDNSYHWYTCGTCTEVKNKAEHTVDETGACTECNALVGATEGVLYDVSADGTYAEVIGYEGTAKRVRIADTYEDVPVTGIYNDAFKEKSITSIIIPDSVTTIGDYAFIYCHSLTSVEILDSVTTIGEYAFFSCTSLTSVVIPDSVTSIGSCAFHACTSLTSVEIPDSVTTIGDEAFSYCHSLTFAEYGNCKYLGNENNPYLALIETTSDNYSSYTIHEDTKIIANSAFSGCARMQSIIIPDSVTTIGYDAFSNCDSLTSVIIGDGVTTIGNYAFSYCDSLTSVVLGDSVTTIGDCAFYDCPITTVTLPTTAISAIPKGKLQTVVITSGDTIGEWAVSYCSSLTSVVIPDSVTTIGNYAFYYCRNLTSVVIPDSVTTIGNCAFYDCDSLTSVVIPDSVTTIGDSAFYECDSLTSVYYKGTAEEWADMTIGSSDYDLTSATRYYYIENEADVPASGNYWHYDANGNVAIW